MENNKPTRTQRDAADGDAYNPPLAADRSEPPPWYEVMSAKGHPSLDATWWPKAKTKPGSWTTREEAVAQCWAHHDRITAPAEARIADLEQRLREQTIAAKAAIKDCEAAVERERAAEARAQDLRRDGKHNEARAYLRTVTCDGCSRMVPVERVSFGEDAITCDDCSAKLAHEAARQAGREQGRGRGPARGPGRAHGGGDERLIRVPSNPYAEAHDRRVAAAKATARARAEGYACGRTVGYSEGREAGRVEGLNEAAMLVGMSGEAAESVGNYRLGETLGELSDEIDSMARAAAHSPKSTEPAEAWADDAALVRRAMASRTEPPPGTWVGQCPSDTCDPPGWRVCFDDGDEQVAYGRTREDAIAGAWTEREETLARWRVEPPEAAPMGGTPPFDAFAGLSDAALLRRAHEEAGDTGEGCHPAVAAELGRRGLVEWTSDDEYEEDTGSLTAKGRAALLAAPEPPAAPLPEPADNAEPDADPCSEPGCHRGSTWVDHDDDSGWCSQHGRAAPAAAAPQGAGSSRDTIAAERAVGYETGWADGHRAGFCEAAQRAQTPSAPQEGTAAPLPSPPAHDGDPTDNEQRAYAIDLLAWAVDAASRGRLADDDTRRLWWAWQWLHDESTPAAAPQGARPGRFKVARGCHNGPSASPHAPGMWTLFVHVQGRPGDTGPKLADELQGTIDAAAPSAPQGGPAPTIEHALALASAALTFGRVERATLHPDGSPESDATPPHGEPAGPSYKQRLAAANADGEDVEHRRVLAQLAYGHPNAAREIALLMHRARPPMPRADVEKLAAPRSVSASQAPAREPCKGSSVRPTSDEPGEVET